MREDDLTDTPQSAEFVELGTNDRVWRINAPFFVSNWKCIFGQGCKGMSPDQGPERFDGCCTEGASIVDEQDFSIVSRSAMRLSSQTWQFRSHAQRQGWYKRLPDGSIATRKHRGGCIFLNRPGFATGPGCALHFESIARGERPLDGKPNICWQFPIRRTESTDDGMIPVSTLSPWVSENWIAAGGQRAWFCTSANEAQIGERPVYLELRDELTEILGTELYERVVVALKDWAARPN